MLRRVAVVRTNVSEERIASIARDISQELYGVTLKTIVYFRMKMATGKIKNSCLDNIKMYLTRNGVVWTGLIWLRIGTSAGFL
jgi:hypothetical protein